VGSRESGSLSVVHCAPPGDQYNIHQSTSRKARNNFTASKETPANLMNIKATVSQRTVLPKAFYPKPTNTFTTNTLTQQKPRSRRNATQPEAAALHRFAREPQVTCTVFMRRVNSGRRSAGSQPGGPVEAFVPDDLSLHADGLAGRPAESRLEKKFSATGRTRSYTASARRRDDV